MPCKTCSHTIQSIGDGFFYCPRCGSLARGEMHTEPVLVERVRRSLRYSLVDSPLVRRFLGKQHLQECVLPEGERDEFENLREGDHDAREG